MGYFFDRFFYNRRQAAKRRERERRRGASRPRPAATLRGAMDVRSFTVGPVAENCYVARRDDADRGLIVDPGDEADRILEAVEKLGIAIEAILLTHCHFDHIGAVAPVARATGAPVYCPEIEVPVLADIMSYVPWPGFGPYESYEADETVAGGEHLELAGLEIDVIFTPGHSPGHVTYAIPDHAALFSGDVLFKGSVGRTDLPGGDWDTLLESIRGLVEGFPEETTVYPGHMGITTLGAEKATNPFLAELAVASRPRPSAPLRARTRSKLAPRWRTASRPRRAPSTSCPDDAVARERVERTARELFERAGYAADRDADLRGHRAVRARGGGVDRHRPQGDVQLRRPRRPQRHPAPRGNGADRPRLPRARHAEAAAAGEALAPGALLPPRAAPGRAAFASSTSSAPRRSAPTRRWSTRS